MGNLRALNLPRTDYVIDRSRRVWPERVRKALLAFFLVAGITGVYLLIEQSTRW